jgi:DNA-binding XRE family transcriptional regulator
MDLGYGKVMNIDEKTRLALQADMSLKACSIRLHAARLVTGMMQQEFAQAAGVKKTTYANMETGRSFPSREVMRYLYRAHRIDFNFILHGDFAQLPADVQQGLFDALPGAAYEWDRRENSSSSHTAARAKPQ